MTASATSLFAAAALASPAPAMRTAIPVTTTSRVVRIRTVPDRDLLFVNQPFTQPSTIDHSLDQFRQPVRAVPLNIFVYPKQVEHAQEEIAGRHSLALVSKSAVSLQLAVRAPDQNVRHIEVLVLIGVAHVGAVHDQGLIEQRSVAVTDRAQLFGEVGHRRDVVPVDVSVAANLLRVLLMVRGPVE